MNHEQLGPQNGNGHNKPREATEVYDQISQILGEKHLGLNEYEGVILTLVGDLAENKWISTEKSQEIQEIIEEIISETP